MPTDIKGCDVCGGNHITENCPQLGLDVYTQLTRSRAFLTLPHFAQLLKFEDGSCGIVVQNGLPVRSKLGPFEARKFAEDFDVENGFLLKLFPRGDSTEPVLCLDTTSEYHWMCYIRLATTSSEQNCMAVQIGHEIYYSTTRAVLAGEELKVWYAPHYAKKLGKSAEPDSQTRVLLGIELPFSHLDDFVATEVANKVCLSQCGDCGLGFDSIEQLKNHGICSQQPPVESDTKNVDMKTQSLTDWYSENATDTHPEKRTAYKTCDTQISENLTAELKETNVKGEVIIQSQGDILFSQTIKQNITNAQEGTCISEGGSSKIVNQPGLVGNIYSQRNVFNSDVFYSDEERIEGSKGPNLISNVPQINRSETALVKTRLERKKTDETFEDKSLGRAFADVVMNVSSSQNADAIVKQLKHLKTDQPILHEKPDSGIKIKIEDGTEEECAIVVNSASLVEIDYGLTLFKSDEDRFSTNPVEVIHEYEAAMSIETEFDAREADDKCEDVVPVYVDKSDITLHSQWEKKFFLNGHMAMFTGSELICVVCNRSYARRESFLYHVNKRHPEELKENMVFACNTKCYKAFVSKEAFDEHMATHNKTFQCDICCKRFAREQELLDHDCTVDAGVSDTLICTLCSAQFTGLKYYKHHMASHTIVNGKKISCENCKRSFSQKASFLYHMKFCTSESSQQTDTYNCSICRENFSTENDLKNHSCLTEKKQDKENTKLTCPICYRKFSKKYYLSRHMDGHTADLMCKNCEKTFTRRESLWCHLRKCKPEAVDGGRFPCDECDKVFNKVQSLTIHKLTHSERFRCKRCHKGFSGAKDLLVHKCKVNGGTGCVKQSTKQETDRDQIETEPGFPSHICRICKEQFHRVADLRMHRKIHKGDFVCAGCSRRFHLKESLNTHMSECPLAISVQQAILTYPCWQCNEAFTDASLQEKHITLHGTDDPEYNSFRCIACQEIFADVTGFLTHYKEHRPPFVCRQCGQKFQVRYYFELHDCDEDLNKPKECTVCQKTFHNAELFKCHRLLHDQVRHGCKRCEQMFHTLKVYNNHMCRGSDGSKRMIRRKSGVEYFTAGQSAMCPVCGKVLASRTNMQKHMLYHQEKQFKCTLCSKAFHTKEGLEMHMRSHSDKRDYQCPYCGKQMKSRGAVRAHIQGMHRSDGYRFKCETCGKRFNQKGNMKLHMLSHISGRLFHCGICDTSFRALQNLRKHEMWHKYGRQFGCQQCEKKFITQTDLNSHVKRAHGNTCYECPFCGAFCRYKATLLRHFNRKHPNDDWSRDNNYVSRLVCKEPVVLKQSRSKGHEILVDVPVVNDNMDVEHGKDKGEEIDRIPADKLEQTETIQIAVGGTSQEITCVSEDISEALRNLISGEHKGEENLIIIIPPEKDC